MNFAKNKLTKVQELADGVIGLHDISVSECAFILA